MINHLSPAELNESVFASYLSASSLPNPDLMIRTSGEKRISNFFSGNLHTLNYFLLMFFGPILTKKCLMKPFRFMPRGNDALEKHRSN